MYSTDDDLFDMKRAGSKKWKGPEASALRNEATKKSVVIFDSPAAKKSPETDNSSDDFLNERDPIWNRKQPTSYKSPLKQKRENKSKIAIKNSNGTEKEDSETDFDFELKRGAALLAKRQKNDRHKKENTTKQAERRSTEEGMLPYEACSSCSDSNCITYKNDSKSRTKLLNRFKKQKESKTKSHKKVSALKPPVERSDSESSEEKFNKNQARQRTERTESFDKCDQNRKTRTLDTYPKSAKAVRGDIAQMNSKETLDNVKEFIGGQLRKGIEKAMASAVMKLNARVRNEADSSNERMELLMKGLMDSYQLISNRVSELTEAYTSAKKKNSSSKHDSSEPMQSETEDVVSIDGKRCFDGRQESSILKCKSEEPIVPRDRRKSVSRSRKSDQTEFTTYRDYFPSEPPNSIDKPRSLHSNYTNTAQGDTCDVQSIAKDWSNIPTAPLEPTNRLLPDTGVFETVGLPQVQSEQRVVLLERLEALEAEVLQLKDRMAANPDRTDLRAIRRLLDDYDEKANQCWKELSSLRNSYVRRHQKTRIRVQQLTEELRQLQAASFSKDEHFQSKLSAFTEQVPELKDSIQSLETARRKSEAKLSSVESYATQIYDACKSTLKSVDLRYQKIKKCYQETRDQQRITDAKCNALAESLALLHQKQKR